MSTLTTADAADLPLEGYYRIENGKRDKNGSYLYAGVYKSGDTHFTAEPKSVSFYQEFSLQYVNKDKPDGTYIIRETTIAASAGVSNVQKAEPVVTKNVNQAWKITKIARDHYTIGQKNGAREFVWDLKDPGANEHQIVVNPSDSSPYQMWIFKNL